MRQLGALAKMTLRAKDPDATPSWRSTGNFHAAVHVTQHEQVVLDAAFAGYPSGDNTAQRFRAQAAMGVLYELLADAEWTPRDATAADAEFVAARRRSPRTDVWWVTERLATIAGGLPGK